MIPEKLTLSGFLSYRDAVTIDFSQIKVACISEANGAGKSSIFRMLEVSSDQPGKVS